MNKLLLTTIIVGDHVKQCVGRETRELKKMLPIEMVKKKHTKSINLSSEYLFLEFEFN